MCVATFASTDALVFSTAPGFCPAAALLLATAAWTVKATCNPATRR